MKKFCTIILLVMSSVMLLAENVTNRHGWPEQKAPSGLIICTQPADLAETMLQESLSGLAAQAVNNGKFDTMVWMKVDVPAYHNVLEKSICALNITDIRIMDTWSLLSYLKKQGVVKGYVLYELDKVHANPYATNPGTEYSANTATVYAGLLKGALIDLGNKEKAEKAGLKCLKDARTESLEECFAKNKSKLNNHTALSIPPSIHNLRDYAIAHKIMLYDDRRDLIDKVLEWVEPLSPILGWGCGDEFDFTSVIARWGHYNSATNWCYNLPFISSVGENIELKKVKEVELSDIDFSREGSFHAFVMSDGDNIQWSMNNYLSSDCYMGGGKAADAGMSWTSSPTNLSILTPVTWNAFAEYQNANETTFIEYGGGYQYPDLFAIERENRPELLREFARRVNAQMEKTGVKVFGFICRDVDSPEALEAYQIYAEEMPGITGMLAVQYAPYELDGEIYWVKNKAGIDIPVMTSRYSIWNEVTDFRPRAGVPEFVASLINRDVTAAAEDDEDVLSWTIVHAWSNFAETSRISGNPAVGYNPTKAAKDLLMDGIHTVSINELLWRVRMKYRPEQTKALLNNQ